ncbi:acyl-CoA dehydrogenase family protein [Paenarthrobacter aurescens]|uniref:acyl-CoA dehydrogenase family protein n=1 Tax=Paenarthrobacter aurescens TaxID=43663 RepID=UPI0035E80691
MSVQLWPPRSVFQPEHEDFRKSFVAFLEKHVVPEYETFEQQQFVSKEVWHKAAESGFLLPDVPEEYSGVPDADFRFNVVIGEELNRRALRGFGLSIQNDIVPPYLLSLGSEEQKERWLPRLVEGSSIAAIAMTEPGAGSDLAAIRMSAQPTDDGGYVLNGQKTFISNGQIADVFIIVARTTKEDAYGGLTLFLVEGETPGFTRGKSLNKLGMHAQDTSELFLDDVRLPASSVLGEVDKAFTYLKANLARERLSIAVGSMAAVEGIIESTIEFVKERPMFGRHLSDLQNTRFEIADLVTKAQAARALVDSCIESYLAGELTPTRAAMVKLHATTLQVETADRCLQLHGGTGYMSEAYVARMWRDGRAQTIYGGTSEVMKHIIGKDLLR